MLAPSACSGLKVLVECPGVMSTVTCCASSGNARASATVVVKRFNTSVKNFVTGDSRICGLMATELQRQEARHFTSVRQIRAAPISRRILETDATGAADACHSFAGDAILFVP